jgi:hypothetical protein
MKATFIGDPTQPDEKVPDSINVLGVEFEKGKASEIPVELEAKFAGHSHFKTTGKEHDEAKK